MFTTGFILHIKIENLIIKPHWENLEGTRGELLFRVLTS